MSGSGRSNYVATMTSFMVHLSNFSKMFSFDQQYSSLYKNPNVMVWSWDKVNDSKHSQYISVECPFRRFNIHLL